MPVTEVAVYSFFLGYFLCAFIFLLVEGFMK